MKQCKLFHTTPSYMAFFVCSCKYLHPDMFDNLFINNMCNTLLQTQTKEGTVSTGNCFPEITQSRRVGHSWEFNALKAEILTQFGTIKSKIVWPRLEPFFPLPSAPFDLWRNVRCQRQMGSLAAAWPHFRKGDPELATCHRCWRPLPYQLYNSFGAYISCA